MHTANDPSPEAIAQLILEKYPPDRIRNELSNFYWNGDDFKEGWEKRRALEKNLRVAIDDLSESGIAASITEIYRWGFERNAPNVDGDDWRKDAGAMIRAFSNSDSAVSQQKDALNKLLGHKGIKIATASKWVCFCDQTKYAIYDSRVSIALRDIVGTNGRRFFPTVGRRQIKGSKYPYGSTLKPSQLVEKYFLYLDTLRIISKRIDLRVAEIEMALFMIGE